jgi:hypothetical protein
MNDMKPEYPGDRKPRQQIDDQRQPLQLYSKRADLVTPYASLSSKILDINVNGGAWDVAPSETDCKF